MGYRDEKAQLEARVERLEQELGEAGETISRLTGATSSPETTRETKVSRLTGGPRVVALERELELEVSEEGLEAIAALVHSRMRKTVQQVGRTLVADGFELTREDGRTRIRMTGNYEGAAFGALSLSALGGLFAAGGTLAILHDAFIPTISAGHLLWTAPIAIALAFLGARKLSKSSTSAQAEELEGLFEAVVLLAKKHRVAAAPAIRVATEEQVEEEVVTIPAKESESAT